MQRGRLPEDDWVADALFLTLHLCGEGAVESPAAVGDNMRIAFIVGLVALVSVPSWAQRALPKGGEDFARPGFTLHTPGRPWAFMHTATTRDNSTKGSFPLEFGRAVGGSSLLGGFIQKRSGSTAVLDVVATVLPYSGHDKTALNAFLMDYGRKLEAEEVAASSRRRYVNHSLTETTLNGAPCIRREAVVEDTGVPHHQGEVFTLTIHGLLCSDPYFPAYIVRDEYSVRLAPGDKPIDDAEGMAARNSLKFKPLGYRISFIPLGDLPQVAAEADGAIWVAYGYDQGKVGRIDPKTDNVTAVIPVGRVPIGVAADASGLWVANHEDNTVSHIDTKTNTVIATIPVGGGPQFVASGAGAVWVTLAGDGKVARIDPATGRVTKIDGVGKQPAGITVMDGTVYVTDYSSDMIACIDPATNLVKRHIRSGASSNFLLADKPYLWANSQTRQPAVLRIDPATPDAVPARYSQVDFEPSGMAKWNGKLFVPNWAGATVSVIDPDNTDAIAPLLPAGEAPIFALPAQGALWVVVSGAGRATGTHGILQFTPVAP